MTDSSRAFAAMLKIGPPVTRDVTVQHDAPVRAPDGADLLADVYLARGREPLPVILLRTPYGRRRNCSPAPAARTPISSPGYATLTRRVGR
jgi:predicted acyl esterase